MSNPLVIGVFATERDILEATDAARRLGFKIQDVHTPYAVHGMDEAMGLRPSRLPWICFAAGITGAILKLWFEFWTTMVDWPVNVGGKPWNSLPAFVPVTFEVMVLSAGLTTVAAFLFLSRLRPGKTAALPAPRITNDRFVPIVEETGSSFDLARIRRVLEQFRPVSIVVDVGREVA